MNLTNADLSQLSKQLKQNIDSYCADHYDEGPRSHLGASEIGKSCSRYLWYKFRWVAHKHHDGRMQRLFQRGHFEEPRFCGYLEGIGFKVQLFAKALWWHSESDSYFIDSVDFQKEHADEIDAEHCLDVTKMPNHLKLAELAGVKFDKGKMQIRISDCKGHFGGSTDGIAEHPQYGRFLTEFKTQATGKKFVELCEKGVKLVKPEHFAQMSMYGYKLGLQYAIYMAVNKNDDDLHVEVVELDWKLGEDLVRKAELIIFSETPPNGIGMSVAYFECGWCDMKGICHLNEQPLRNCRSCKHSKPVDNAEWQCEHYGIIPKDAIKIEQPCWESII